MRKNITCSVSTIRLNGFTARSTNTAYTNVRPCISARTYYYQASEHSCCQSVWWFTTTIGRTNFDPYLIAYGRDNSVGIANRYALDGPAIESLRRRHFPHSARLVIGPTQPRVQKMPRIFPGDKAVRGVALTTQPHLALGLKKKQSCASISRLGLHGLL